MRRIFWRSFFFVVNPFRKTYWFIFRPKTRGSKCIVCLDDKILLVRLGYAHKSWTLPGGGVNRFESHEEAARREVKEEVGISIDKLEKVYEYESTNEYKKDKVEVYKGKVDSDHFKIDGVEVVDAGWFDLTQDLPENISPRFRLMLDEFFKIKNGN